MTKQCSFPASSAYPPLHQSLLGSPLPGHTWSPSNIKCQHAFHLSSYENLVQWDTQLQSWCWREVLYGLRILERALHTLQLPTDLAVPLLPGQAWHLTASSFLAASAKITQILHVSTTSTPAGFVLSRSYTVNGIFPTQFPRLLDPLYFVIPPLFGRIWVPL